MNNYLAKPVRAAVLKEMVESYLEQRVKPIPNLQQVVADVAKDAMTDETEGREGIKAKRFDVVVPKEKASRGKSASASSGSSKLSSTSGVPTNGHV